MKVIVGHLQRHFNKNEEASRTEDSSELSTTISVNEDNLAEANSNSSFEELIKMLKLSNDEKGTKEPRGWQPFGSAICNAT